MGHKETKDRIEAAINRGDAMDRRRQTQIARQSARISALTEYLEERGLLRDFNEWDRAKHGI